MIALRAKDRKAIVLFCILVSIGYLFLKTAGLVGCARKQAIMRRPVGMNIVAHYGQQTADTDGYSDDWQQEQRAIFKDIVHVTFTSPQRHELVKASRLWREPFGIRQVMITNVNVTVNERADAAKHGEIWGYWPDMEPGWEKRAYYKGDLRAAMAPFLAHNLLGGGYKWLLYGDDDTMFFSEGVLKTIDQLDHRLPYFISDSIWGFGDGSDKTRRELTPRCVPCNFEDRPVAQGEHTSHAPVPPLIGCPCTTKGICEHWTKHAPKIFTQGCGPEALHKPTPEWMTIHGDAGAILSVALLEQLNVTDFQRCLDSYDSNSMGGDSYLSKCIWRGGFGITDPGYSYLTGDTRKWMAFDRWTLWGEHNVAPQLVDVFHRRFLAWTGKGFCKPDDNVTETLCTEPHEEDELAMNIVTAHLGARFFKTVSMAARAMQIASTAYQSYVGCLHNVYKKVSGTTIVV